MIEEKVVNGILCWMNIHVQYRYRWEEYSPTALTRRVLQLEKENEVLESKLKALEVVIKELE